MMNLNLSPQFTIEDIRKVRDYDYEMTKNMSWEEKNSITKKAVTNLNKKLRVAENMQKHMLLTYNNIKNSLV